MSPHRAPAVARTELSSALQRWAEVRWRSTTATRCTGANLYCVNRLESFTVSFKSRRTLSSIIFGGLTAPAWMAYFGKLNPPQLYYISTRPAPRCKMAVWRYLIGLMPPPLSKETWPPLNTHRAPPPPRSWMHQLYGLPWVFQNSESPTKLCRHKWWRHQIYEVAPNRSVVCYDSRYKCQHRVAEW